MAGTDWAATVVAKVDNLDVETDIQLFKLANVFANCWAVRGLDLEVGTTGPVEELGPAEPHRMSGTVVAVGVGGSTEASTATGSLDWPVGAEVDALPFLSPFGLSGP